MADGKKEVIRGYYLDPGFKPDSYEYDDRFIPGPLTRDNVRTTADLVALLERDPSTDIEARVLSYKKNDGSLGYRDLNKEQFLESFRSGGASLKGFRFRENIDAFATDQRNNLGLVGDDFIPVLGGPFFKQLYYYDYIRMISTCFWAANHDPVARAYLNILNEFTLGRGYRIDTTNTLAQAIWEAFEKANDIPRMMNQVAKEMAMYGEIMVWKLPNQHAKIMQAPYPGQKVPLGVIPRVRLIDPSVIWEIVTWPEDVTKVLFYTWVAQTNYQVYSGLMGDNTPTAKFIFQTIPPEQMLHYKINSASNEKRGRSDFFPVLGFMKRLRDSVNYQLIALQKQSAWSIDTTIEGNQGDVDAYITAMQELGTYAPAGSEFAHTAKIKREFLSSSGGRGGSSESFQWSLSMICAGLGVPISYMNTHLSGGSTRASAIVATEPVTKKFELRQMEYERIIHDLWDYCMDYFGLGHVEMEVSFPELVTVDRTAKLKDLVLAQSQSWISKKRAAEIASKELGITDFDYEREQEQIDREAPEPSLMMSPLTDEPKTGKDSALSSEERKELSDNRGF